MSLLPKQLLDLSISLFLVPGNFVVRTAAEIATGFFKLSPNQSTFVEGSQLALWVSVAFWFALIVETIVLWRYFLAMYSRVRHFYHRIQERAEQRLRRYRILRACQDAADYPSLSEETTIVEEIGQLDALTATALRLARDQNPDDGVTVQSLSSALSASKHDILRALEQLEQLQFVSREPDRKPAKANYKLMPAGDLYLKVCEIRELA